MIVITRWQAALCLYLIFVFLLLSFRPALLFDAEHRAKTFGAANSATISVFSPAFVFPLLAVFCYYLAALVELSWA